EERAVGLLPDVRLGDRGPEARPAGAGLELRVGGEEREVAADAVVRARGVVVPVLARERSLRALLGRDLVLLGRELGLPLRVGLRDAADLFIYGVLHGGSFPGSLREERGTRGDGRGGGEEAEDVAAGSHAR